MPIVEATYSADLRATILSAGCQAVDGPALTALCNAIAAATVRALHTATLVVAPGIPVVVTGSPTTQAGATTAPGTGSIT